MNFSWTPPRRRTTPRGPRRRRAALPTRDVFFEYAHALFVDQPPEARTGLSDATAVLSGLGGTAFTACVSGAPYLGWPPYVTARATARGVEATPTVLVAGTAVRPEARSVAAAVAEAAGGR